MADKGLMGTSYMQRDGDNELAFEFNEEDDNDGGCVLRCSRRAKMIQHGLQKL